jgi:uncharacterized protein YrrD
MSDPEIMKYSDLIQRVVRTQPTMMEAGRVETLWMYPQASQVLGIVCKPGLMTNKRTVFKLTQLHAVDESGILVEPPGEETTIEKVRQLESLIGLELWSNEGVKLGKITDCLFKTQTGRITHYLFAPADWGTITRDLYQVPCKQVLGFGEGRALVKETAIYQFPVYREGLRTKLWYVEDFMADSYDEAQREWRSLTRRFSLFKTGAREKFQTVSEHTQSTAEAFADEAQTRSKDLGSQLQEKTKSWFERAKEASKTWTEQVKEKSEQVKEKLEETLEEKLEPILHDTWDIETQKEQRFGEEFSEEFGEELESEDWDAESWDDWDEAEIGDEADLKDMEDGGDGVDEGVRGRSPSATPSAHPAAKPWNDGTDNDSEPVVGDASDDAVTEFDAGATAEQASSDPVQATEDAGDAIANDQSTNPEAPKEEEENDDDPWR